MGRGKGCIDLDEVERFGLDITPSRQESRDMLARHIAHLLSNLPPADAILKELIANRDELLADESDELGALAGDLFIDTAYKHSKLLHLVNGAISLTSESEETPFIVQDQDFLYHLRESREDRQTLCGLTITWTWKKSDASPHGIWANTPSRRCHDCQFMLEGEIDYPAALLRAAQSTSANHLEVSEAHDVFVTSAEAIKDHLASLSVEELKKKKLSDLTIPTSGAGRVAAPFIAERLLQMAPADRLHWMVTGDGNMFPTYVAQIKKEYGAPEDLDWPDHEDMEEMYSKITDEYFSKYPTWNGRIIYPIFLVAHLWPKLLRGYAPGIDPFELATKTIADLKN